MQKPRQSWTIAGVCVIPIKPCLLANHLQEALIVHLLVRKVIAVTEKSIGGNRRRSVLRLLLALQMDGFERHAMLLRHGFKNWYVFAIEGTLTCVIQDVTRFVGMGVLRTILEFWGDGAGRERQIPKLDAVIGLVAYLKTLISQVLRISKERFLLGRGKDAEPRLSFVLAVLDTFLQKVVGITMPLEGAGYP